MHQYDEEELLDIPESFDARKQWPECPTIGEIRDQGSLGACWAFGPVEAISDRICIKSKGQKVVRLSVQDLITCCRTHKKHNYCGQMSRAWNYWKDVGIVTGGGYHSKEGCRPYMTKPNGYKTRTERSAKDRCQKKCQKNYPIPYEEDLYKGKRVYDLNRNVTHMQKDIMKNGPVSVMFKEYADFGRNTHKVYIHKYGKFLGVHSVKLIGWGVQHGIPYWLAANSGNYNWGLKGFFKIRRGHNECLIEQFVVAGEPLDDADRKSVV